MRFSSFFLAGLLAVSNPAALPEAAPNHLEARKGGSGGGGSDDSGSGSGSGSSGGSGKFDPKWKQINKDLNSLFMVGGQCNDLARAAIRAIFDDCGSWDTSQGFSGGCDGSLIVGKNPDDELARTENRGLQGIAKVLGDLVTKYTVPVADMIVFAGNAAIFLCPDGPKVKTLIGRTDNKNSAKQGGLPNVFDTAQNLFTLFQNKGYDTEGLAALLGAHSTSTQNFVDETPKNASQDFTPGRWDVSYYSETYNYATKGSAPAGVFVFPSDSKLSTYSDVGKKFQGFIGRQEKWASSFSKAMEKMALFGNNPAKMVDSIDFIQKV